MKVFYLPMEVKTREFEGKCLLAAFAALKGYHVFLGRDANMMGEMAAAVQARKKVYPGVLMYNAVNDAEYDNIYQLRKAGVAIISMPEESLPVLLESPDTFDWFLSKRTLELSTRVLMWGERFLQHHCQCLPGLREKAQVAGFFHYDLLRYPFRKKHDDDASLLKKEHGPFILFLASQVGFSEIDEAMVAFRKQQSEAYGFSYAAISGGTSEAKQALLGNVLTLIKELREKFPDRKIIFRPHPMDQIGYWQELLQEMPGVEAISAGSAIPWVLASDCLIHTGSSVAHQALFLRHPQIYYEPSSNMGTIYHGDELFRESTCKTNDEVIARLGSYLSSDSSVSLDTATENCLRGLYANYNGQLACLRVLQLLDSLDWEKEVLNAPLPAYISGGRTLKHVQAPPGYYEHKFASGFSLDEVKTQLASHEAYISEFASVKVEQLSDYVFLLHK